MSKTKSIEPSKNMIFTLDFRRKSFVFIIQHAIKRIIWGFYFKFMLRVLIQSMCFEDFKFIIIIEITLSHTITHSNSRILTYGRIGEQNELK